jgi:hypothetical protein
MAGSGAGNVGCVGLVETVETQNTIIHLQADVITELFGLLAQYLTVEELDGLDVVKRINLAADLRKEIETK